MKLDRPGLYLICTAIILFGFAMLIQPLSMTLFSWGLPVMLVGIVLHMILDHLKEKSASVNLDEYEKGIKK